MVSARGSLLAATFFQKLQLDFNTILLHILLYSMFMQEGLRMILFKNQIYKVLHVSITKYSCFLLGEIFFKRIENFIEF